MSKAEIIYLKHIYHCIVQIQGYMEGIEEEAFYEDELLKDGVVRNFEVLGEATKQVTEETRQKYPEIEWKKMAGMRDKLIHGYFDVDYNIVWTTVQDVLPNLERAISRIIDENAT